MQSIMSDPDLYDAVVDLIHQVTDVPADRIYVSTRFDQLDGWASLAALRLLTDVEDRFHLTLDLRQYFAAARVAELVDLIGARLPASTGPVGDGEKLL